MEAACCTPFLVTQNWKWVNNFVLIILETELKQLKNMGCVASSGSSLIKKTSLDSIPLLRAQPYQPQWTLFFLCVRPKFIKGLRKSGYALSIHATSVNDLIADNRYQGDWVVRNCDPGTKGRTLEALVGAGEWSCSPMKRLPCLDHAHLGSTHDTGNQRPSSQAAVSYWIHMEP